MDNDKILEIIISVLPYAEQITEIDTSKDGYIYFSWRGEEIKVGKSLDVEVMEGNLCLTNNFAIVLRTLLKKRRYEIESAEGD